MLSVCAYASEMGWGPWMTRDDEVLTSVVAVVEDTSHVKVQLAIGIRVHVEYMRICI